MQDFTDKNIFPNNLISAKQPKWLTKDRFWNFVFWFGMSFGMASAAFVKSGLGFITAATVIMWSTIILIPLTIVLANKTRFIKKDTFANSEGIIITKEQQPKATFLSLLFGVGLAFVIAETVLPKENGNFWAVLLFFTSLFSGISLYFILKNCPISILFNSKYWELRSSARDKTPRSDDHHERHIKGYRDKINSPIYQNLPGNVHYRHR